jgi:phospholipid/cholesterol/gamma-HCH transport system substrate-binding protein
MARGSYRYKLYGLLGVGLIGLSIFAVAAGYTQMFVPVVHAKVVADRSGLLLEPKAAVSLRGIKVGTVRSVRPADGQAVVDIAIDRKYVNAIPQNIGAQIIAPTIFGAKFVDLTAPALPSQQSITNGAVLQARHIQTEVNSVFDSLMALLTSVKPAQLDATLGALATALQGHGGQIGQLVGDLNNYLTQFNPTLPVLRQDLAALPNVVGTYAGAAPNLVQILGNSSVLSQTVQDKQAGLAAFWVSVTRMSDDGRRTIAADGPKLVDLLDTLRPTSQVLAYYSPEFPCMFDQANKIRYSDELSVGGLYDGINMSVGFLPGQQGYQQGKDNPVVGAKGSPMCYPYGQAYLPHYAFNDGTTTIDYTRSRTEVVGPVDLAKQLLGPAIEKYVGSGHR